MKTNGELISQAKEVIKDYKGTLALSYLLYLVISCVCIFIPIIGFFASFVQIALILGMLSQAFNLSIGNSITVSDMFIDFKIMLKYILASFILGLIMFVSIILISFICGIVAGLSESIGLVIIISLITMVPAVILSIMVTQVPFILIDDKHISAMGAIKRSIELTKNNKMKVFLLDLHFIPLFFLSGLCLGIPLFWIMPHYYASKAQLYLELKEQYDSVDEIL